MHQWGGNRRDRIRCLFEQNQDVGKQARCKVQIAQKAQLKKCSIFYLASVL